MITNSGFLRYYLVAHNHKYYKGQKNDADYRMILPDGPEPRLSSTVVRTHGRRLDTGTTSNEHPSRSVVYS